jgi:hypothetical protein
MRKDHVIPAAQRAACELTKHAPTGELQSSPSSSKRCRRTVDEPERHRGGAQCSLHSTPAGRRHWHPTQVRRVLAQLAG